MAIDACTCCCDGRGAGDTKRIWRLYCEEGLAIRPRLPRRRLAWRMRIGRSAAAAPNEVWAMDFMSDGLFDGRPFRLLTVIDCHTREALAIVPRVSFRAFQVVETLDRLARQHGKPRTLKVDNGPEFAGRMLDQWTRVGGKSIWLNALPHGGVTGAKVRARRCRIKAMAERHLQKSAILRRPQADQPVTDPYLPRVLPRLHGGPLFRGQTKPAGAGSDRPFHRGCAQPCHVRWSGTKPGCRKPPAGRPTRQRAAPWSVPGCRPSQ